MNIKSVILVDDLIFIYYNLGKYIHYNKKRLYFCFGILYLFLHLVYLSIYLFIGYMIDYIIHKFNPSIFSNFFVKFVIASIFQRKYARFID